MYDGFIQKASNFSTYRGFKRMTEECGFYQTTHLTGWECPRCHIINSPYKLTCTCLPKLVNASTTGTVNLTDMGEFGSYIIEINK